MAHSHQDYISHKANVLLMFLFIANNNAYNAAVVS